MSSFRVSRLVIGGLLLGAAVAYPAIASAQASTFIVPFDRLGAPGTECKQSIDPVTGLPVVDANGNPVVVCTPIGALQDPCTLQNVDVTGSTTLSISQNLTGSGQMKVSIGSTSKGTGMGWSPSQPYLVGVNPNPLTATKYSFADNQQFTTQFTLSGDPTTLTSSTFTDKFFVKGAKSTDNWTIKATITIKINGQGVVTSATSSLTGDICKG